MGRTEARRRRIGQTSGHEKITAFRHAGMVDDCGGSGKLNIWDKWTVDFVLPYSPLTKSRLTDSMMTLGFDRG